jgi:hypothetical protein
MTKDMRQKQNTLKQYEAYGYQIAYYLLENEHLAMQASIQALMELINDEEFFRQPQPLQKQKAAKVFMRQSIQVRKCNLQKMSQQI